MYPNRNRQGIVTQGSGAQSEQLHVNNNSNEVYNIVKNAKSNKDYGAFVDLYNPEEYKDMNKFSLSHNQGNVLIKKAPNIKIKGIKDNNIR